MSNLQLVSEPEIPVDAYASVLSALFGDDNEALIACGVNKALAKLGRQMYPAPSLIDFDTALNRLEPIVLTYGSEILSVARNFRLDSFAYFDWITADFDKVYLCDTETRNELIGYAMRRTLYTLLRDSWTPYENVA